MIRNSVLLHSLAQRTDANQTYRRLESVVITLKHSCVFAKGELLFSIPLEKSTRVQN